MTSLLVFDGDCGFCTRAAQWISHRSDVAVAPWQTSDLAALALTREQVQTAAWMVGAGAPIGGSDAIAAALRRATSRGWRALGAVLQTPGIRRVARLGYRVIARNRRFLPGSTTACALPPAAA